MGFMNWLMKGVGFENEEVYDDTIEKQKIQEEKTSRENERRRRKEEEKARKAQEKADKIARKYSLKQEKDEMDEPQMTSTSFADNPEQYNTSRSYNPTPNNYGMGSNVGGYGSKNVEFVYPTSFEEVKIIIKYLQEGESIVLNLGNLNDVDAQRFLDCVSGASRALNGNIQLINSRVYLFTPEGFNIRTPNSYDGQQ